MVVAVVLVIPPVRVPQHPLPQSEPAAGGLDALDHRLQFLGSVDREHLAHVVAFARSRTRTAPATSVVGPIAGG